MARPLKHWLYKHRDNPYPTKTEKVLLALGSHMTLVQVRQHTRQRQRGAWLYGTLLAWSCLRFDHYSNSVQVSNWFANARRRLKNTVRQPDLSWALRIKLYNKYIQGNAERLSVCSDDTDSDGEGNVHPRQCRITSNSTQVYFEVTWKNNHRCIPSPVCGAQKKKFIQQTMKS